MENRKDSPNNEVTTADADLITLMRAAALRTRDPGAYEKVMALESNKGSKVLIREEATRTRFGQQICHTCTSILDEAARLVGRGGEGAAAKKILQSW